MSDNFCCFGKHENIDRCGVCPDEGYCIVETKWVNAENDEYGSAKGKNKIKNRNNK